MPTKKLTVVYDSQQIKYEMIQFIIQSLGFVVKKWDEKSSGQDKVKSEEDIRDTTGK